MRKTKVNRLLGIDHPILQAGVPWVSNPELVAAVSNAGGMGVLHPTAGMALNGDIFTNLRENIRQVMRLTNYPFGVTFYLAHPQVEGLMEAATLEGMRIAITFGGSPALYTGALKNKDVLVLHQVATIRHARGAQAQGVDIVIAQGFEGGGIVGPDELSTFVLVPQVAEAVSIPVIASGGIIDARGMAGAMALGAEGVYMGTRFVATEECIAHPKYKEALLGAIDTGTVLAGGLHRTNRILRTDKALQLKDNVPTNSIDAANYWDANLGLNQVRGTLLDGDLEGSIAYCGSGVGLISEIMPASQVVSSLVDEVSHIVKTLG